MNVSSEELLVWRKPLKQGEQRKCWLHDQREEEDTEQQQREKGWWWQFCSRLCKHADREKKERK